MTCLIYLSLNFLQKMQSSVMSLKIEPALDDPGEVERHSEDCLSSFIFDCVVVEMIGNGWI